MLQKLAAAIERQWKRAPSDQRARAFVVRDSDLYQQMPGDRNWSCGFRNIQVFSF